MGVEGRIREAKDEVSAVVGGYIGYYMLGTDDSVTSCGY